MALRRPWVVYICDVMHAPNAGRVSDKLQIEAFMSYSSLAQHDAILAMQSANSGTNENAHSAGCSGGCGMANFSDERSGRRRRSGRAAHGCDAAAAAEDASPITRRTCRAGAAHEREGCSARSPAQASQASLAAAAWSTGSRPFVRANRNGFQLPRWFIDGLTFSGHWLDSAMARAALTAWIPGFRLPAFGSEPLWLLAVNRDKSPPAKAGFCASSTSCDSVRWPVDSCLGFALSKPKSCADEGTHAGEHADKEPWVFVILHDLPNDSGQHPANYPAG